MRCYIMPQKKSKTTASSQKVISDNTFVLIEYTAREKETGKVFDTTSEEVAKKEKIYDEHDVYGHKLVIIGEGWFLKGFEDRLKNLKENEEKEFEIPPEEAFGPRDPSKIEHISLKKFVREGIDPKPGMQVRIGNRVGTVLRVGAGRVTVDFNHPLAGKTLSYSVKVVKIIDNDVEKVKHLVKRRISDLELDKINITFNKSELDIMLPDDVLYQRDVEIAKRGIARDIFKYFPQIKVIRFIEEIKKEEPQAEEEGKKEANEEAKAKNTEAKKEA